MAGPPGERAGALPVLDTLPCKSGGSGKSSFDVSGLGIYFIRNGRFHLIVRYCPLFCQKVAGPARTSQSTVGGGKNQLKVFST